MVGTCPVHDSYVTAAQVITISGKVVRSPGQAGTARGPPLWWRCDHVLVPDNTVSWREVAARLARNYWLCTGGWQLDPGRASVLAVRLFPLVAGGRPGRRVDPTLGGSEFIGLTFLLRTGGP